MDNPISKPDRGTHDPIELAKKLWKLIEWHGSENARAAQATLSFGDWVFLGQCADALTAAEQRAKDLEAENARLREALELVRGIIVDGAMVGFNPLSGDWAERLYASQAVTYDALNPRARSALSTPTNPEPHNER